ncbi:MAG: hypothetical protein KAR42_18235, partial [candidate division Zixibacteria bacterium]|nr:hypothetical protein [candidate division Zixibacteria bacterium]
MAIINLNYKTLADQRTLRTPDGTLIDVANILEQSTPLLKLLPFIEGNLKTGHKGALLVALPTSTFVKYYQGISPSKGTRQTVTWATARQRSIDEFDADLLELDNNRAVTLMQSGMEHIMGMGQDFEDELWYGTKGDPDKIVGLAPTYDHLSASETDNGYNVIDGGGVGADNTSMWMMYMGNRNIHGIYPKGSTAGIKKRTEEKRLTAAPDGNGEYEAVKTIYKFDGGLAIPDWRSVVRIANIDVSELDDAGESTYDGAALINLLIKAMHKFKANVKAKGK